MADLAKLQAANAARWSAMKVKTGLSATIDAVARRLVSPAAKARFQALSERTGVPWAIIAVIKEREAGADPNWLRSIAQGDPWKVESTHVPKGRGPFKSWDDAAFDALTKCAPYAARWKDWSPGGAMTLLEQYNGLGYANGPITKDRAGKVIARYPSQASPYIWASTDQYVKGKYIADGVFDPNHVDTQIGCAALLARMIALDSSANFALDKGAPTPIAKPAAAAVVVTTVAAGAAHTAGLSGSTILFIALAAFAAVAAGIVIWSNR